MDHCTEVKNSKSVAPTIKIKKEKNGEDIKEFAETAMNELLGWYGYGNHSRDDKRRACRSHSDSSSSESESTKCTDGCGWCGKPVEENHGITSAAATFCSELCFSQSRRANFKKNKTCDWCRHIRNAVTYIESQDGTAQLQFCSEKCLNQYKMHIFCRETQAHLELHPHISSREKEDTASTLITPDLWMRNCKSPKLQDESPSPSPKIQENQPQTSPLPLITVAHPSKLLRDDIEPPLRIRGNKIKKNKRSKISSAAVSTPSKNNTLNYDTPQDLRMKPPPVVEKPPLEGILPPQLDKIFPKLNFPPSSFVESPPRFLPSPRKPLEGFMPPPTVLVPYPIILPIPIPVPIPVPLGDLFSTFGVSSKNPSNVELLEKGCQTMDLDFFNNNNNVNVVSLKTNNTDNNFDIGSDKGSSHIDKEISDNVGIEILEETKVEKVECSRPLRKRKNLDCKQNKVFVKSRKTLLN